MIAVDKRNSLFELDEIFKYKSLINRDDKEVIKAIIYNDNEQAMAFYHEFMKLVAMEVNHELNKTEFAELKDQLIVKMEQLLKKNQA